MAYIRLTVILIIGVLQVCTANPIASEEEGDPAKLFSADELQHAKNVGLPVGRLVEGKSFGLTFDEQIKLFELRKNTTDDSQVVSFAHTAKVCAILVPGHQTATTYTSAQETVLPYLFDASSFLLVKNRAPFLRSTYCAYVSQPDLLDMEASAFGLELIPYALIRYSKTNAQKASGAERVQLTKEMCCVYKRQHLGVKVDSFNFNFSGLADEEMKEFGERWNGFETANTLQTLNNVVCEFLSTKSPTDECTVDMPVKAGPE